MIKNNTANILHTYVENNEVVYQCCGELMEISNDTEKENKKALLGYLGGDNRVVNYTEHGSFVREGWAELTDWSTDDDVLFLLDGVGVMICIPKKEAIANNLIEA